MNTEDSPSTSKMKINSVHGKTGSRCRHTSTNVSGRTKTEREKEGSLHPMLAYAKELERSRILQGTGVVAHMPMNGNGRDAAAVRGEVYNLDIEEISRKLTTVEQEL